MQGEATVAYFKVLSWHLAGGSDENHKLLCWNWWSPTEIWSIHLCTASHMQRIWPV